MRIGEATLTNRNYTVQITGFTAVRGIRITNRMRAAWERIPLEAFWSLMQQMSANFVSNHESGIWNPDHLQTSNANRIFCRHSGRGSRHQFRRTTLSMCSENPRYIFMSIEIDRLN